MSSTTTGPVLDRRRSLRTRRTATSFAGALVLSLAIGGATAAQSESAAPSQPQLAPMTVAINNVDFGAVPMLAAVDSLREQGQPVLWVQLAAPELGIECVARNQCQFQGGSAATGLTAIQAGAPLRIVADYIGNQWSLYGRSDITACADLDGKRIGIFSEGANSTAMVRAWVGANCREAQPEYLVMGDSVARVAAMLQGQIDATPLELSDSIAIEAQGGDDFAVLASFIDDLPDLKSGVLFSNADFVVAEPDSVVALLRALIDQHERMSEDAEYFRDTVLSYIPETDPATLEATIAGYQESGLFDAAAVTPENIGFTLDFFTDAGVLQPGLTLDDVADLSLLERATAE